jgi:hypothetical protein
VYVPVERHQALVRYLLDDVVVPGGRLILCGCGSPHSAVPVDPVHAIALSYGLEPQLAFDVVAPERGGASLELAVLPAGQPVNAMRSWPRGVSCPVCGDTKHTRRAAGRLRAVTGTERPRRARSRIRSREIA